MTTSTIPDQGRIAILLRALLVFDSGTFLVAGLLHLGVRVAGIAEPPIADAATVEFIAGLALAVAAAGVVARARWAWYAALAAQALAAAGVSLGMAALAFGLGPTTMLNFVYHRVMLVLLIAGLAVVILPAGRQAFGKR
jgi:hypothetical protein